MPYLSRTALVVTLLSAAIAPAFAAEGNLGFETQMLTTRLFSPRLNRVVVTGVSPGSAAAAAGLEPGDVLLEVNDHQVSGATARDMAAGMAAGMASERGQHLRMKVRNPRTGVATLDLIGAR